MFIWRCVRMRMHILPGDSTEAPVKWSHERVCCAVFTGTGKCMHAGIPIRTVAHNRECHSGSHDRDCCSGYLTSSQVPASYPDSKVLSAPDGPHVGPMNLAIWDLKIEHSVDFIYGCPIFQWLAGTWPQSRVPGYGNPSKSRHDDAPRIVAAGVSSYR